MPVLDLLDVVPATLDDDGLLAVVASLADVRRRVDAKQAEVAAEVAHRSRREHGTLGLAQRLGAITPDRLLERVAGVDGREAKALIRVGELLTADAAPWLTPVGTAIEAGDISIAKADAIRAGLGAPTSDVAADDLTDAAAELVRRAPDLTVGRVAAAARAARDDLDLSSIAERERALRDRRYLALTPRSDGMTRIDGLLDPESAATVAAVFDAATSPRRGGPRFIDPDEKAAAERLVSDERTIGQIALDTFIDLLRIGADADPTRLLGGSRHSVRVLVTAGDLVEGAGAGFLSGQDVAVSIATVERHLCATGILPVQFDDAGEVLRLGRERRLFSRRQRIALEARDGGCRFPQCDRPASWAEAHHLTRWTDGGTTDVDQGILLCRHHHLHIHDNGWQIRRDPDHGFRIVPPPDIDPARTPIPMPSRSRVLNRLRR